MHQRKRCDVKADNNCFFRAVAKGIFNDEEEHHRLRSCVTRFMLLNKTTFEAYMIPSVNGTNISEHIFRMVEPGTWATHLEVIAVATYFNLPVFYVKNEPTPHWEVINPLNVRDKLCFPIVVEWPDSHFHCLKHLELAYFHLLHYDFVTTLTNDQDTPVISTSEFQHTIA